MELLQLKYFCDAAMTENFSHTAKKFMVPQSAVSQSVKKLENELGQNLFNRNANKISLNEYGQLFYNHINAALNEIELGKRQLSSTDTEPTGNISVLIKTNRRYVTDCIAEFKKKYPMVEFTLFHEYSQADITKFDLIVDAQPPEHKSFLKEELVTESILIAVSKEHKFAEQNQIKMNNLENESFISMPQNSSLYKILENLFCRNGLVPNITIYCDDPFYIRKYTSINLGITLIPAFSWSGFDKEFNIKILPLKDISLLRTTYLFHRRKNECSRATLLFKDFILDKFRTLQK